MAIHNDLGKAGELLAKEYLVAKGYKIVETNFRVKRAEIDIIAIDHLYLVVVEVKTRSEGYLIPIAQTVSDLKIHLLIRAANYYVQRYQIQKEVRFDIVTVSILNSGPKIEHLIDAFYHF
jgi:putative endonuclease